ncbi:hypothetical protein BDZ94DRAFT_1270787 [Collybia nuda]|uniref:Uncharacterized protein n=1 Tax=Collybia nuda TaxID=64659 RepID=A0A9P6CDQ0_9AGAR|nr:hypothetical protein BDZ94DRAFT_1270787 [Collybia nuda]
MGMGGSEKLCYGIVDDMRPPLNIEKENITDAGDQDKNRDFKQNSRARTLGCLVYVGRSPTICSFRWVSASLSQQACSENLFSNMRRFRVIKKKWRTPRKAVLIHFLETLFHVIQDRSVPQRKPPSTAGKTSLILSSSMVELELFLGTTPDLFSRNHGIRALGPPLERLSAWGRDKRSPAEAVYT